MKPILNSITSTLYVIPATLSKTSHQLCRKSQEAYVCNHMPYTWHHIHPLWQQPSVFMTSHALYMTCHLLCMIHYMCDITQCLYLWHYTVHVYDISTLYGITHSVMKTQPLCKFTAIMSDITPTVSILSNSVWMTSQPLYIWHHMHYIWHHINCLGHHTTLYMPQVHYFWPHVQCIRVITLKLSVISQTLYIWHDIQYICDIVSTIFMT